MEERIGSNRGRVLQRARKGKAVSLRKRQHFLEHLAATCNVRASARTAGINLSWTYQLRKREPAFAAAWKDAMADGYARLEEGLLAHALASVAPIDFDPAAIDLKLTGSTVSDGGAGHTPDGAGDEAPGAIVDAAPGGADGKRDRPVATVNVRLALQLLNRRDAAERNGRQPSGRRRASDDEVGKAINAKLDALAARLVEQRG